MLGNLRAGLGDTGPTRHGQIFMGGQGLRWDDNEFSWDGSLVVGYALLPELLLLFFKLLKLLLFDLAQLSGLFGEFPIRCILLFSLLRESQFHLNSINDDNNIRLTKKKMITYI